MAVTLKVTGNGEFRGSATNLTGYTVNEDSVPINLADSAGGTGGLSFSVIENDLTPLLMNDTVELIDDSKGSTTGTVNSVGASADIATVNADSRMNMFMIEVNAAPFNGTVYNAFVYYFGLAGITSGFDIDNTLTTNVTYKGFQGNLWDNLKQLASVTDTDINLVSNNIIVRKIRNHTLEVQKNDSVSWQIDNADVAQNIEITSYNNTWRTNGMIYPPNGWTEDMQIIQVDAKKTVTVEIQVDASIQSLEQPTVADTVPKNYTGPSVYAVAGNDGLPIPAAQWTAGGGKMSVSIGKDRETIIVKVTGMKETKYSPYRIAVSSGSSEYYSTLRLRGTGLVYTKEIFKIPTGAPNTKTAQDVGVTIDSAFVRNDSEAFTQGMKVAQVFASPRRTISVTSRVVNRRGDKGTANYPTFADFNAANAGKKFSDFNTTWTGQKFSQFNAAMYATVQDDFENQAFGNVAGSRFRYRGSWYRVRSATLTEEQITYSGEADTTFADFNVEWAGKKFSDFNAAWSGYKFSDFTMGPLAV